ECRKLGYKRIGLAMDEEMNQRLDYRWMAGYLAKQHEWKLRDPLPPLLAVDFSAGVFLDWVKARQPDAVIVIRPEQPIEWLTSAGYRVPEDIGVVTLDPPKMGSRYSGVYDNFELQGVRAINL